MKQDLGTLASQPDWGLDPLQFQQPHEGGPGEIHPETPLPPSTPTATPASSQGGPDMTGLETLLALLAPARICQKYAVHTSCSHTKPLLQGEVDVLLNSQTQKVKQN